jgi:hypothetical protein
LKDYYSILGIPQSASQNVIRDAYRKLAKRYHPDVNSSPDADRIFKELNEAYEVLGDPEKRAQYDQPVYYEPTVNPEPVHRNHAYRRRQYPPRQNDSRRMEELMEEYKPTFLWLCRIGIYFSLLMAIDLLIPPASSLEEITDSVYYRGSRRTASSRKFITEKGTRFNWYPEDHSKLSLGIHSKIRIKSSRIFRTILVLESADGENSVWIARIYTRLVFFPVLLLVSSCLGILFKRNANVVLNFGTLSFVLTVICFFLVI